MAKDGARLYGLGCGAWLQAQIWVEKLGGALEFSCSLALLLLGARGMPELLADIPISRSLVQAIFFVQLYERS